MTDWNDQKSAAFREIASVAVPRHAEMMATILALVPFGTGEPFTVVEIGSGTGRLGAALLDSFPKATLVALDGSESTIARAARLLQPFGHRAVVRSFELASLDWWDLMRADVVVSSLCLHHLNDAKKQYLFRAAAERLSPRGALLVADRVEAQHPIARRLFEGRQDDPADHPSPLFFQLVWLKHAGFESADCFWAAAGHAVYGGFKTAGAAVSDPLPYATARESVARYTV
jgi:tRNA (cmo5U34)-methyltransferase